jgi:hypothetical protein
VFTFSAACAETHMATDLQAFNAEEFAQALIS